MITAEKQTAQTALSALVNNYAKYNAWAMAQMVTWLKNKPEELLTAEVASSFPSIRQTLTHLWDCQKFWLAVIKHEEANLEEFTGTNAQLFDEFTANADELAAFVATLTEDQLLESHELVTPWFTSNLPVYEYVQHVMNHGTYHRGQVVTIGRQLGLTDAPMTDYNLYNIVK
nr:DinB family protein [uncultured Mucilaginibacter sp.]